MKGKEDFFDFILYLSILFIKYQIKMEEKISNFKVFKLNLFFN